MSPSYPNLQDLELLLTARVLCWPHFTALLAEGAMELSIPGAFPMSIRVSNPTEGCTDVNNIYIAQMGM